MPSLSDQRLLIRELAEDFAWLEGRSETASPFPFASASKPKVFDIDSMVKESRLRIAAALVRNCLGPFLEDSAVPPLHLAVVGGAGAGKSTLANFLIGSSVADANPQAGYTRHPIAYSLSEGPQNWTQHLGFLGGLERVFDQRPSSSDLDVYQIRKANSPDPSVLQSFVVWDCPDMTTWAATGYTRRLLEVVGLADLVVYVASDERYNDEVPTQYLRLILQAGKPVLACITKVRPEQATLILDHFQREVIARIPECPLVIGCIAIPFLTPAELAQPLERAEKYRAPLLEHVKWFANMGVRCRQRTARGAVQFLVNSQTELMATAQADLQSLETWNELIQRETIEFTGRYEREYLSSEKFPRFDEALVRLLQLLELPGVGRYVSNALWVVRTPYRWAKDLVTSVFRTGPETLIAEEPVLRTAWGSMLDGLQKETARRRDEHQLWKYLDEGFRDMLPKQAKNEFDRLLKDFHTALNREVDATARAIFEELEKNPMALNSLRTGKFALEAASIVGAVMMGGISALDLVIVPLTASITQELVEFMGKQYVDGQREGARERQRELFRNRLVEPLSGWLRCWPEAKGTQFERLQLAVRRVPANVQALQQWVHEKLGSGEGQT